MSEISSIITVNITRQTQALSQASFGIINIVGENSSTGNRIDFYTTLSDVAAGLDNGTADPEYFAAREIFSQSPTVEKIAISHKEVGDVDYSAALDAIKLIDNSWYGLIVASRTVSEQQNVADWTQANEKVAAFASAGTGTPGTDNDFLDEADGTDVTSIGYYIKTNAHFRSMGIYSLAAATKYVDAGMFGVALPKTPGTYTMAFKTISGATVDKLTTTQSLNVYNKYSNTYTEVGGKNLLLFSKIGDGDYIDTIIFVDWLKARIAENVFGLLARHDKIPYSDAGISQVKSAINQILSIAQTNGALTETTFDPDTDVQTGGYVINVPLASSIPVNDKAARNLTGITFTAWYSGAVHTVQINGTLTL